MIKTLHHIAIIVSSEDSIDFYKYLGFTEEKRIDRGYDQVVWLSGYGEKLEIFIDATHPKRLDRPEALGLRHIAFVVDDISAEWERLKKYNPEAIRITDEGKRLFFVKDPDGVPIEFRD